MVSTYPTQNVQSPRTMDFTSFDQMHLLDKHLKTLRICNLEFNADEFSQVLFLTPNIESCELNGALYRYGHLFAKQLPILQNLTTLYFKHSEDGLLQHFKKCPVLTRLLLSYPKNIRQYDMDPLNYDESNELLQNLPNLKIFTLINPLQIFKRDISCTVSFQLTEFLVTSDNDCTLLELQHMHLFLGKQKKLESLVMENIMTIGLLKLICEEMLMLKKLELYGIFDFPNTTNARWGNLQKNMNVKHLVIGSKNQKQSCSIDKVLALFQNVQILELKFVHLSLNEMNPISRMEKLLKISFSECHFSNFCRLPLFLNEVVCDNISKRSILNMLQYSIHIEKLTLLRYSTCDPIDLDFFKTIMRLLKNLLELNIDCTIYNRISFAKLETEIHKDNKKVLLKSLNH